MPLDAIDAQILLLLRGDGRTSSAKLAATVGLSPSAYLRRLNLLQTSGTIQPISAC